MHSLTARPYDHNPNPAIRSADHSAYLASKARAQQLVQDCLLFDNSQLHHYFD